MTSMKPKCYLLSKEPPAKVVNSLADNLHEVARNLAICCFRLRSSVSSSQAQDVDIEAFYSVMSSVWVVQDRLDALLNQATTELPRGDQ